MNKVCAVVLLFVSSGAVGLAHAKGVQIVYYDISGRTGTDLIHELETKGPLDGGGGRFPAYTKWRVSWNYRYESMPGSCKLISATVSADGTMTLPRWINSETAPESLVREWQNYSAALRVHEDGHFAHGLEAATEIEAASKSIQPAENCSILAQHFNDQAQSILNRYIALDEKYDRDTDHGRTQGAIFVVNN